MNDGLYLPQALYAQEFPPRKEQKRNGKSYNSLIYVTYAHKN